jgi:hypothetical protein
MKQVMVMVTPRVWSGHLSLMPWPDASVKIEA